MSILHPSKVSPMVTVLARVLALAGWASLIAQFFLSIEYQMQQGHGVAYGVFMYTGYFTILTNSFCALVATSFALTPRPDSKWMIWRKPWVVTAATVAIIMVGLIFHVMLRHTYQPEGLAVITNLLHHYAIPISFPLLWWLTVPKGGIVWQDLPKIFAYPAVYLPYVALRGELSGVYPYGFMDVAKIGYSQFATNAGGIALLFISAALAFIAIKK